MSEPKDPAIKLFGKTIPFGASFSACGAEEICSHTDQDLPCTTVNSSPENRDGEEREVDKDTLEGKLSVTTQKEGATLTSEDCAGQDPTARINDNPKTPSIDNETATLNSSRTEDNQSDTGVSDEKTLKKPDKIIPCPRCNSMDTKFCYYNNYNVNQPRHFCKNCQRYWTAGGTMRNVPVGAGRRKNKSSASHYRHITVCEALQSTRSDVPNGVHLPTLKPNGTVLAFGSDSPLCESMASALSLGDKTMPNCTRNGSNKPEELKYPVSNGSIENGDGKLSGSSGTASNSKDEVGQTGMQEPPVMQNCQRFPPQIPCFPGAPWSYPWSPAQWNPSVPPPSFCPSGYPMPFYPAAAYWGCAVPGAWNIPWIPQPSSPKHQISNSVPNSPLGKHSRDGDLVKPSNSWEEEPSKESTSDRCLWIPKTLRIDDPRDAVKSSIWETLGIKNEMGDSIEGRGLFKAFQSKGHEKNYISKSSPVLQANPAALCRSLNFHESS